MKTPPRILAIRRRPGVALALCLSATACAHRPPAMRPVGAAARPTPAEVVTPLTLTDCLAAMPDSLLTRRDTLYLHALILDPGAQELATQADLLAQRVAARARLSLGRRDGEVPAGAPAVTWRTPIGGNLAAMVRRDGRVTWEELLPMPIPDTVITRLLARALDSVRAHGELVSWTLESARDSVRLRLGLTRASAAVPRLLVGSGFPVLVVRAPSVDQPQLISHGTLKYPDDQKFARVEGHVLLEVVVDARGLPEPARIRDAAPLDSARAAPEDLADHEAFLESAATMVAGSRFTPGRFGGCPVRMRIQVPMNYTVARDF